jgi:hypothetical protein
MSYTLIPVEEKAASPTLSSFFAVASTSTSRDEYETQGPFSYSCGEGKHHENAVLLLAEPNSFLNSVQLATCCIPCS